MAIVDRLGRRLRAARRVCRTVMLRLRFDDSSRATRSYMPLIERQGITLLGLTLGNLENDDAVQLALPLDRRRSIDSTIDDVRDRFGSAAITRAVLLGRSEGFSPPLLPD